MRDLIACVEPDEIHAAALACWRTDSFRRSHEEGGVVHSLIERLARLPRFWCELDDPAVERSHFLAWMSVIPHRHEYTNPAISDLYYLHEYLHAAALEYGADQDSERWTQKIWDNERDASLGSEVFIYFDLPDLRPQTFAFEIWADRYLADPEVQSLHREDHAEFVRFFEHERDRAMTTPRPGDANESLIATYADLNVAWAKIWRPKYLEVERELERMAARAKSSRREAAEALGAWLDAQKGDGLCPFEDEARRFATVVHAAQ